MIPAKTIVPAPVADSRGNRSILSAIQSWIKRYPIITMVALIYLLAWPFLITLATDSYGLTHFNLSPLFNIPTGLAPAIAAFVVTAIVAGKEGTRELLSRMVRWRVGWPWYLVALLLPVALFLAGPAIYGLLTGEWAQLPIAQMSALGAFATFTARLVVGGLINTEEVAWRGFALPRLQNNRSALRASLILWIPWTLLHLPYFFIKGNTIQQEGAVVFALQTLALTIIFTWLFNNTRGSVLLCTVLHAAFNAWPQLLIAPGDNTWLQTAIGLTISATVVIALILRYGPARLSRQRGTEAFITLPSYRERK